MAQLTIIQTVALTTLAKQWVHVAAVLMVQQQLCG